MPHGILSTLFASKAALCLKTTALRTVFKKSELPDVLFLLVFPYVWPSLILILFSIVLVYYCITAANENEFLSFPRSLNMKV